MESRGAKMFFLISAAAGAAVCVAIGSFDVKAGLAAGAAFLFFYVSFLTFTRKRYRSIKELSDYLAGIYSGNPTMDIRDNKEGELSILKNDIYKVTKTLAEQSELLKKDKQYLADTLSDISHQLKTPLTSMYVMTDVLSMPDIPGQKREECLGNILNQLKRIEWLVTSLLKLSRIDAQAVTFKKEKISVRDLIKEALRPMLIPAELKSQEIETDCGDDIFITADKNWTAEALVNIIKNCIEHTPEGGRIKISCHETVLDVKIVIEDNGEGIEEEDIPYIFDRFYKGKNAGPDSVGIGLAMSKAILVRQNADIWLESTRGKGTRFVIKFYQVRVV
ncbi:sensor histidine kinase [Murimonas intestini]|uniref:sensor histidine kinase n=1 Tax=Murimonas intestini TaxID=1337051 RepID=UPI0011DD68A4|nr:HAMP domain-containing sensor histidine kinase [Murimonas intestini]